MKAAIYVEGGRTVLDEKRIPEVGPLDALMRITTTTIRGTDSCTLKGEYPVVNGLTIGHEPVGIIKALRKVSALSPASSHPVDTVPLFPGGKERML